MGPNYFTSRDRGHIEEIKRAIEKVAEDYKLDMSSEIDWLNSLNNRFVKNEKYVRVAWPESQEWMDDKYDGHVIQASDEHTIYTFVPEELYNRVKGE